MDERILKLKDLWFTYSDEGCNRDFIFYGNADKEELPKNKKKYFAKEMVIEFSSAGALFITADVDLYERPPVYNEYNLSRYPNFLIESNQISKFIESHEISLDSISEKRYKKPLFKNGNDIVGNDCKKSGFKSMMVFDIKDGYYKNKKTEDLFFQKTNVVLNIDATTKEEGDDNNE